MVICMQDELFAEGGGRADALLLAGYKNKAKFHFLPRASGGGQTGSLEDRIGDGDDA